MPHFTSDTLPVYHEEPMITDSTALRGFRQDAMRAGGVGFLPVSYCGGALRGVGGGGRIGVGLRGLVRNL